MTKTLRLSLALGTVLLGACGQQVSIDGAAIANPAIAPQRSAVTTGAIPRPIEIGEPNSLLVVETNPTDTYAAVARGAHACWLGASGPMKRTHMFQAQADSPAKGGAAEIVLLERDATMPEGKGARAFRVAFVPSGSGTQVAISPMKIEAPVGLALSRDVQAWSRGDAGCQLRAVLPSPPEAVPQQRIAKSKPTR